MGQSQPSHLLYGPIANNNENPLTEGLVNGQFMLILYPTINWNRTTEQVSHLISHLSTNGNGSFMGLAANLTSGMTGRIWDWVCAHLGPRLV